MQKNLLIFVFISCFTPVILAQDTVSVQIPVINDSLTELQIDSIAQAQLDSINQVRIDSIARAHLELENKMLGELADILERIPAENIESLQSVMEAVVALDTFAIQRMMLLLDSRDPAQVEDAEFAIAGVAKFLGGLPNNELKSGAEKAFCDALVKATSIQQQVFLIDQLQYFGSDHAVAVLSDYLISLCDPVTRTLVAIGTSSVLPSISNYIDDIPVECRKSIIKSIYRFESPEAIQLLKKYANDEDPDVAAVARHSLAKTSDPAAYDILTAAANKAGYDVDPMRSTSLLLQYASNLISHGNLNLARTICTNVWEKSPSTQLKAESITLMGSHPDGISKSLLKKIFKSGDPVTIGAAIQAMENSDEINPAPFFKLLNKSDPDVQVQLIHMAAARNLEKTLPDIKGFIESPNPELRIAAIQAISSLSGKAAIPDILEMIQNHQDDRTRKTAQRELSRWIDSTNLTLLDQAFMTFQGPAKASIIDIIADRNMNNYLHEIIALCASPNQVVTSSALQATEKMATLNELDQLLQIPTQHMDSGQESILQRVIVKTIKQESDPEKQIPLVFKSLREARDKSIILKMLSNFQTELTFTEVANNLFSSDVKIMMAARQSLFNWRGKESIPVLFDLLDKTSGSDQNDILNNVIGSISRIHTPDEQKLLLLRKCFEYSPEPEHIDRIIQACGNLKTFTAFMFSSRYLDDDQLKEIAAQAAISIALPDEQGNNGLTDDTVITLLRKAILNLDDADGLYTSMEVQRYINEMPEIPGFYQLFNGKDLSGWKGLVENPIARSNMTPEELTRKQREADAKLAENWVIKDGKIVFIGRGYDNLCSTKSFKDFELLVDWKISKNSDSGIYLRGSPQVQIWDTSMTDIGAYVGSGGLFNNQKFERIPLKVADNPTGDWNTFLIRMIGDKVTVYLNGEKVVDYITMENYWRRSLPIFESGPIELQAHTTDVEFRDIYIREIDNTQFPTKGEQQQGFVSLFNGINLDGWVGNKVDYQAENGAIVIKPGAGGGTGNLYTREEYDNFKLRFDFKLTPGANNGLGFHAPLEGDAAYLGKELQILDNTHEKWENLEDYQYHGSLYGVMPAARGHLLPVGEWNRQEVTVQGSKVDVVLNGRLILSGDWKEASQEGTPDDREHPGLERYSGHIGFLGHGDEVAFRNIRIQKLGPVDVEE